MSKFNCSYRLLEKYAKIGSTSHAWIALHRCVEAYASTKGQSFQATFEVLEAKFTFERENNSLDIQTILRCASFLKEDRHSFLEKLNREIIIRKMEKKAGKRLSSNSAFLEICHAQTTYKKPKVGFWGWRNLKQNYMNTNFTIESWNSLSTEWQKIYGINLIANFRLSSAQRDKIFQFGQNPFDCYKATFGKQFKSNVIEEEISLLPQLETLFLADLNLNEIPLVEQLSKLKNLDICCNIFTDLDFLANCNSLEILLAEKNKISDISTLNKFNNLKQLNLRENKLKNIDDLQNLVQLNYLDVGKNQINELSSLTKMNLLTELQVDVNLISSCSPLVGLTNLSVLVLAHNSISDLEKLNSMKSLQYLDIQGIESSEIVDFSELKTLPDFEFLK